MSRSMPMDSMTCALRSEPSAYCCAAMAARLAATSGGCVFCSFSQPMNTCANAPMTEAQPSMGLMANTSARNTSDTGASIAASRGGELKKSLTVLKSFSGCRLPPGTRLRLASKIAVNIRLRSSMSSFCPALCMTSDLAHSRISINT